MDKKYQIVSFGEALIDFTPDGNGAYVPNPGGAPFNLAVCAAKYGCATAFVGKLGKDAFGNILLSTAESYGVYMGGVSLDDVRVTTHAFVTLDGNGDRSFVFCREHGADVAFNKTELPYEILASTALFHFGGLSLTHDSLKDACVAAIGHAADNGALISFDPNYRSLLWRDKSAFISACNKLLCRVDILKVSAEEALMLTGAENDEEALATLSKTVPVVLLTKGADGAVCAIGNDREVLTPTVAKTVDTTGAGDIFFGSFLAMMLTEGYTISSLDIKTAKRIGDRACRYAAKSTEEYGAIPSIPNFSEEN